MLPPWCRMRLDDFRRVFLGAAEIVAATLGPLLSPRPQRIIVGGVFLSAASLLGFGGHCRADLLARYRRAKTLGEVEILIR